MNQRMFLSLKLGEWKNGEGNLEVVTREKGVNAERWKRVVANRRKKGLGRK